MSKPHSDTYDLFIIGGGVNGCGIARDAAGRGIKVGLAEMNDIGSGTSSASTKLFHGGLRYLEYFEFRLVREALVERETLLQAMPHISWPMRFVLPYHADMRFEGGTPTSKLLTAFMPWMKGRRPAWLIRLGLFIYDHMGGRKILPSTRSLDLTKDPAGAPLNPKFRHGYEYSDCWIEDSRLVVLNARDAAAKGAEILPRTKVVRARRQGDHWQITLQTEEDTRHVTASMLVNAGGPWVGSIIQGVVQSNSNETARLVRGSHLVTKKLFDHDRSYFFQGADGRIIFAIPYEHDFTLIGTTDAEHDDPDAAPVCTPEERDYLLDFASNYFAKPVTIDDVVWTYSGVRPLYDDGSTSATAATRDYVLKVDELGGAPLLNIFGGKITTYRKLAEAALDEIAPRLHNSHGAWTAKVALPGGDFAIEGQDELRQNLLSAYPFLSENWAQRLIRAYGTDALTMLGSAKSSADLGTDFGHTITERELAWSVEHEWTRTGQDFLWRRTKLGLRTSAEEAERIDAFILKRVTAIAGSEADLIN